MLRQQEAENATRGDEELLRKRTKEGKQGEVGVLGPPSKHWGNRFMNDLSLIYPLRLHDWRSRSSSLITSVTSEDGARPACRFC